MLHLCSRRFRKDSLTELFTPLFDAICLQRNVDPQKHPLPSLAAVQHGHTAFHRRRKFLPQLGSLEVVAAAVAAAASAVEGHMSSSRISSSQVEGRKVLKSDCWSNAYFPRASANNGVTAPQTMTHPCVDIPVFWPIF